MHLVVSFSGGETSGFMLGKILNDDNSNYESINVVFANTGQECEETLEFVKNVGELYDTEIVWLEAKVNPIKGKGIRYTIVDFDTASRNGEPFEAVIKKYGIPNSAYLHCTRDLKSEPIKYWCKDNFGKDYEIAIGIRLDQKQREPKTNMYQTVYPLITEGYTKEDVLDFWSNQPFRLGIKNYQGNCRWCYKKSDRKLRLLAHEDSSMFDFPDRMEQMYGLAGHNVDGNKRKFFRNHRSAQDIVKESQEADVDYVNESKLIVEQYEEALFEGGCSESCEAFADIELFNSLFEEI